MTDRAERKPDRIVAPHPSCTAGLEAVEPWAKAGAGNGGRPSQFLLSPSSFAVRLRREGDWRTLTWLGEHAERRWTGPHGTSRPVPSKPRKRGVEPGTASRGVPSSYPTLEAGRDISSPELYMSPETRFLMRSAPKLGFNDSTLPKYARHWLGRKVGRVSSMMRWRRRKPVLLVQGRGWKLCRRAHRISKIESETESEILLLHVFSIMLSLERQQDKLRLRERTNHAMKETASATATMAREYGANVELRSMVTRC